MATKVKRTDAEIITEMQEKMMNRPNRNLGVSLWSGAAYTPRTTPIPPVAPLTPDKIGKPAGESLRNRPAEARPVGNPASPAQVKYILDLVERKGAASVGSIPGSPTSREAREIISRLLTLPDAKDELTEGMYTKGGEIFKVQMGSKGFLYALILNEAGKFDFVSGAIRKLTVADRMTLEEAKAYGKKTGTCCVCSWELTNPDSVEAGIGPWCASKF